MTASRYMLVAQLDLPRIHRVPHPAADSALLAAADEDLRAALAVEGDAHPILAPIDHVALVATCSGNNLYASLISATAADATIALIGVPRRATAGPRVWGEMTQRVPTQIERPPWPWIALTTDYSLLPPERDVAAWLISYAAALGWTWIEHGTA